MGITRNGYHKRVASGAKQAKFRSKRKHELGRPPAHTRIGAKRVSQVRTRGGNTKQRALRLDHGNFSWGSQTATKNTRILRVVHNYSSNELIRQNALTKSGIVEVDATPFAGWYKNYYGKSLVDAPEDSTQETTKSQKRKQATRSQKLKDIPEDNLFMEQFKSGRLLASIVSRPGQTGRADGILLEGHELSVMIKKLRATQKKHQH